jgi:hypothetical protein
LLRSLDTPSACITPDSLSPRFVSASPG